MHDVAILAMHGTVPLNLAIPCDVFGRTTLPDGTAGYRVRICGEAPEVRTASFDIRAPYRIADAADAHTLIIPGVEDLASPPPRSVLETIREAARNGARIASICGGAFILAATGLLDGKRATTHWLTASRLQARYPEVEVDPNVLFVDSGQLVTSAGASAGLDMCLHLVRRDHGQAVAARVARLAVAALQREGGQAQFIQHEPAPVNTGLSSLIEWMQANLREPLSLGSLARRASTSPRTLSRRFKEQTGTTPLQWLSNERIRRAQALLETTGLSVEEVAAEVGFDGPSTFRSRFRRTVGVSPHAYRRSFRA